MNEGDRAGVVVVLFRVGAFMHSVLHSSTSPCCPLHSLAFPCCLTCCYPESARVCGGVVGLSALVVVRTVREGGRCHTCSGGVASSAMVAEDVSILSWHTFGGGVGGVGAQSVRVYRTVVL